MQNLKILGDGQIKMMFGVVNFVNQVQAYILHFLQFLKT